jgi:exopolysaccharide biosynthesis polyprenyl glycosylphosphotransferase
MIRLFHVNFPTRTLVLATLEVCFIALAFLLVGVARSADEMVLWLSYDNGVLKIAVVSAVLALCMYYFDLYDSVVLGNRRETLARLFQVLGTASVALALLYFFYPEARLGRATFLVGIGLAGLALVTSRHLFLTLNRSARFRERVLILGDWPLAISLWREIEKHPELGMRLFRLPSQGTESANGPIGLGEIEDLPDLINKERITRLIAAADERDNNLPIAELLQLKKRGVMISDATTFYETLAGKLLLDSKMPNRLLFSSGFRLSPGLLIYKRAASIVLSALGLVLLAPLMAVIAMAICAESGGPVLFRQRRVGRDKKVFTLYKFRSMRSEVAPGENFQTTQLNDERCTRLGRWLRRFRLDELPQLYNILRGDMHFIGPRPFALEEEEELAKQIPNYPLRWMIDPGATGWAQVQQGYCASVEDNTEKLAYDLFYLQNISVGFDLLILFRTTKILLWGRGAR